MKILSREEHDALIGRTPNALERSLRDKIPPPNPNTWHCEGYTSDGHRVLRKDGATEAEVASAIEALEAAGAADSVWKLETVDGIVRLELDD